MTLSEAIHARRMALNVTQKEAARRSGISPQYLNDIELGRRVPPPDTILALASALETAAPPILWLWVRQQMGDEAAQSVRGWLLDEVNERAYATAVAYGLAPPPEPD